MSTDLLPAGVERYALDISPDGVARVGKTRVTLDLVVELYESGMTPEEIVSAYETLQLADVYASIAYYLRHREQVTSYMNQRARDSQAIREKIESTRGRITRHQLLARGSAGQEHAAARQ